MGAGEGPKFPIYFPEYSRSVRKHFEVITFQIKISKISPYCPLPQTYPHRYGRSHKQTGKKTYNRRRRRLAYTVVRADYDGKVKFFNLKYLKNEKIE